MFEIEPYRLGIFLATFLSMGLLEYTKPRRLLSQHKWTRWFSNISLSALSTLLIHLTLGVIAVTTALYVQEHRWGLLTFVDIPQWGKMMVSLMALDFGIYIQHLLFHRMPLFWRFHRVHHTDLDFDVSTGIRFHPIEIFVSLIYKVVLIIAIGTDPITVVIFEIILNASSLFNHSNFYIPESVDQLLRWFLVTPDVHRVHHSALPHEFNTNFGFSITWWDRLCGTFKNKPEHSHTSMDIGLKDYRDPKKLSLLSLLILPFRPQ